MYATARVFRRFRRIAKIDFKLCHVCLPVLNYSAPTRWIFMQFHIWVFFENLPRHFKFDYNRTRITGTSREDQCTFLISRLLLLRRKYTSDKCSRENQNTRLLFSNFFFRKSCHLWDNVEKYLEPNRPQVTKWRMRIAYWIPNAINTHSYHVILITFPLQQWFHDRASVLRYTYIAFLFTMNRVGPAAPRIK